MTTEIRSIPLRETLHYLGWRGTPVEVELLEQIRELTDLAKREIRPRVVSRRFRLLEDGSLEGCSFLPQGDDVRVLLGGCEEAMLLAGTIGAESERLLLRMQAKDPARALLLDAVFSAAIEAVIDDYEAEIRRDVNQQGLYLTDRFSPGYGDMPIMQCREICEVLQAQRTIGLTVSASGIMIPRKSVTAIIGVSKAEKPRRPHGCAVCSMRETCALRGK